MCTNKKPKSKLNGIEHVKENRQKGNLGFETFGIRLDTLNHTSGGYNMQGVPDVPRERPHEVP